MSSSPPADTRLSIQSLTNPITEANHSRCKDSNESPELANYNNEPLPSNTATNWVLNQDSSQSVQNYPSTVRSYDELSIKNEKEQLAAQALDSLSTSACTISTTMATASNPISGGGGPVRHTSHLNHATPYTRPPYYSTYSHVNHGPPFSHSRNSSTGSDMAPLVVSSDSPSTSTSPPSVPLSLSPSTMENVRISSEGSHNPRTKSNTFLYRVSKNPLVSKAVRVYNSGKFISAPRFKYGAEMVKRVIKTGYQGSENGNNITNNNGEDMDRDNDGDTSCVGLPPISSLDMPPQQQQPQQRQRSKPLSRSAWNGVLVTATSLASLSEESRRRLRYCLHLLKLANNHLATTVQKLQDAIAEEQSKETARFIASQHVPQERGGLLAQPIGNAGYTNTTGTSSNSDTSFNSNTKISAILNLKADVINTIRKVVTVITAYAGNSLPEPARSHVKNYILRLPSQWASNFALNNDSNNNNNNNDSSSPVSQASSRVGSPLAMSGTHSDATTPNRFPPNYSDQQSLLTPSQGESLNSNNDTTATTTTATQVRHRQDIEVGGRVLVLANEALEMLGNVISVVDDTLQKAELWCDKLSRAKMRISGGSASSSSTSLNQQIDTNKPSINDNDTTTGSSNAVSTGTDSQTEGQSQVQLRQR